MASMTDEELDELMWAELKWTTPEQEQVERQHYNALMDFWCDGGEPREISIIEEHFLGAPLGDFELERELAEL